MIQESDPSKVRVLFAAFILGVCLFASSYLASPPVPPSDAEKAAEAEISTKMLLDDIKVLASDKFEGRAPACRFARCARGAVVLRGLPP